MRESHGKHRAKYSFFWAPDKSMPQETMCYRCQSDQETGSGPVTTVT